MTQAKLQFRPTLVPSLTVLILLPALLWLGYWQWGRADDKHKLISLQERQLLAPPSQLDASVHELGALRYRKVWIDGTYDSEHQFLLDNQVVNGQAGFHVMTPFHIQGTSVAILVNRGWLAGSAARKILPDVALADDILRQNPRRLNGMISGFPGVGYELADADKPSAGWPAVVQLIKTPTLVKRLGYALLPYQLWLDESLTEGYHRDWQIKRYMTPEKHRGYAVQWFLLALLLLTFYLWRSFKPK